MIRCCTIALSLAVAAGFTIRADDPKPPQYPHLLRAYHELREANHDLKEAKHDFNGHRVDAMKAIHVSVEQIELCLKDHGGTTLPKDFVGKADPKKAKHHPHLHEALRELREARRELKEAPHVFDGHRVKAIEAIEGAEKQIELCLKHAK
jgi:hypothetical protein